MVVRAEIAPPRLADPTKQSALRGLVERGLDFLLECREDLGDVFVLDLGERELTVVGHPDLALHVLRTHKDRYATKGDGGGFQTALVPLLRDSFATGPEAGEDWLRQRRLVSRMFKRTQVLSSVDAMSVAVAEALEGWEELARLRQPVDLSVELPRLALSVVAATSLGARIGRSQSLRLIESFQRVVDFLWEGLFDHAFPAGTSKPAWLTGPGRDRYVEAIEAIHRVAASLCDEADAARDRAGLVHSLAAPRRTGDISKEQMRLLVATVLVAGYETMAASLSFAFHYLCRDEACMRRLVTEIDQVAGRGALDAGQLQRLQYARAVVLETLRMSDPIYWIQRQASVADTLGGFRVQPGTTVAVITHLIHHHRSFWPEPATFDPDRFVGDAQRGRHPFAWMPFGIGERKCFAEAFSLVQGVLVLAMVLQRFRMSPLSGQSGRVHASTNLRLVGRVPVMLAPRDDTP
jgi:cytochrome P450